MEKIRIRRCRDCGRKGVRGMKKVVAIEDHYPISLGKPVFSSAKRSLNIRRRLGRYLCRSCRNWLSGWWFFGGLILILDDGTRERFKDKGWEQDDVKTGFILIE